jgi:uncharacterized LabA/DUF88 family protein
LVSHRPGFLHPIEPTIKRAVSFVGGQDLFHAAREAFGYSYPNYDALRLSQAVCALLAWRLVGVHFYTGVPGASDDPVWHRFWTAKLATMGWQGVRIFSRPLRYRPRTVRLEDGRASTIRVGQEKGVDVRMALDVVRAVLSASCEVALIFSQDQDFSEVALEVRRIARDQGRWFKIASAFPFSRAGRNRRGIDRTDWISIDRATYDACLDRVDYRPRVDRP